MAPDSARSQDEGCTSEFVQLGRRFVCQREAGRHRNHYKTVREGRQDDRSGTTQLPVVVEWSDD